MQNITYLVAYATRADWGADKNLPRLGYNVPRWKRTEAISHHTGGIDPDVTPLVWETRAECFARMRYLQTVRPDLGLDVPYNEVGFPMRSKEGYPALLVCEGRGPDRTGAHTADHNTSGYAVAIDGDWENYPGDFSGWAGELGQFFGWRKFRQGPFNLNGMKNLGSISPVGPREVFGHRDLDGTACPGINVYKELGKARIVRP